MVDECENLMILIGNAGNRPGDIPGGFLPAPNFSCQKRSSSELDDGPGGGGGGEATSSSACAHWLVPGCNSRDTEEVTGNFTLGGTNLLGT